MTVEAAGTSAKMRNTGMFKDVFKFRDQPRLHEDRVSAGGIQAVTVPHDKAAVSRSKISNSPKRQTALR